MNYYLFLNFVLAWLVLIAFDYALLCLGLSNVFSWDKAAEIPYTYGYLIRAFFIVLLVINSDNKRNLRMLKKVKRTPINQKTTIILIVVFSILFTAIPLVPILRFYLYPGILILLVLTFTYFSHTFPKKKFKAGSKDGFLGLYSEPKAIQTAKSLPIPVHGGFVNIIDRNRHILTVASTGGGKSYSIGYPAIDYFIKKGIPGLYYDLKYPTLAEIVYTQWKKSNTSAELYVINLVEAEKSHRCNIFNPKFLHKYKDLERVIDTFFSNIIPDLGKQNGSAKFFTESGISIFKSWAWFTRNLYYQEISDGVADPKCYCTLPHLLELCLLPDISRSVKLLETDPEVMPIIASIRDSVPKDLKSKSFGEQLQGVLSSLKYLLPNYITKENHYLFSGNDFDIDINNPDDPKIVVVNSLQGSEKAYGPLAGLFISSALSVMNNKRKLPSYVFLDEFQSIKLSNFNSFLQSCRSNGICVFAITTDILDLYDTYTENLSKAIIGKFNNQFWGAANTPETADRVVKLFGKEDKTIINKSKNSSSSYTNVNSGSSISENQQERFRLKSQEVINLNEGEFFGMVKGAKEPMFKCHFTGLDLESDVEELPVINENLTDDVLKQNFIAIRMEAYELIESLAPGGSSKKEFKPVNF